MSAAPYPDHRAADVALRDGSTVHVRPVLTSDEAELLALLRSLSDQSRLLRFFTTSPDLQLLARRFAQVDQADHFGLIAITGAQGRVVGHGEYCRVAETRAEVGFTVADDYQGRGLGTLLLGQLAEVAAANGVVEFEAVVMAENHRMIDVFREAGFPVHLRAGRGQVAVSLPTALDERSLTRFEQRDQIAASNALRTFFSPRAVAMVGASRQPGSIGARLLENLRSFGFAGPIYPVNPAAVTLQGLPAYPDLESIPGPVDLAVIAVPAALVIEAVEQCARKGIRAVVVISAGFGEIGEAGERLQAELLRRCRALGVRLIGPNCFGIVNTDLAVLLNATFGPLPPPAGRVGFASQSGALGLAAIDFATSRGIGLSTFASFGNKADISGNDLLCYWEDDPQTDLVLLYLESFGNPRKFGRIARRVSRRKPVIAVKSGRSSAGARATASHTGALLAASDVTVDALFEQCGVIRTDTLAELLDAAALLANQPLPRGGRVGIVTNAGGPAILCADTCEAQGLEVPLLAEETRARLRALLPKEASVANPVDMIASAGPQQFREVIPILAADPSIDAVVAIFTPPLNGQSADVAVAIRSAAEAIGDHIPLLAVFVQSAAAPGELRDRRRCVPAFTFPEAAAIALRHAVRYARWRSRPEPARVSLEGIGVDQAAGIVARGLARGDDWLPPSDVAELLHCYGIALAEQRVAPDAQSAGAAAEALGGRVALKVIAPGLVHKSDLGGVDLDLEGAVPVTASARAMAERLRLAGFEPSGFLIQRMLEPGVEIIVGVVHDPLFGPVLACGAGGVMVELLRDVAVRLTPLAREDALEMLRSLKTFPLLTGYRGAPPRDLEALADLLVRVGALADDLPEVAELDFNPVLVGEHGLGLADARVRLRAVEPPLPLGATG